MPRLVILLFLCFGPPLGASLREQAQKEVEDIAKTCPLTFSVYEIPGATKSSLEKKAGQEFFRPELYMWQWQCSAKNQGLALVDNTMGKDMPITFLVVFNGQGQMIHSSILKYRESYGGEVSAENWLKGFRNKSADSGFIPGKDIDVISGATISVYSVTKGFYKLALLAKHILSENESGSRF